MPEIGYLRHESGNLFSGGKKIRTFPGIRPVKS